MFTENERLNQQLKKTIALFTKSQLLNNQLKNDSVEHKKRIDELFTENERLNQKLKTTKAFFYIVVVLFVLFFSKMTQIYLKIFQ